MTLLIKIYFLELFRPNEEHYTRFLYYKKLSRVEISPVYIVRIESNWGDTKYIWLQNAGIVLQKICWKRQFFYKVLVNLAVSF